MKDWSYFDKFEGTNDRYLPAMGEGETLATQTVTAVTKLVYKWYNDGDVYDNVHSPMSGWCNDLSSYANWLWMEHDSCRDILARIDKCYYGNEYEDLLADLADLLLDMDKLAEWDKLPADETIYDCDGPFEFSFDDEDEDDEWEDEWNEDGYDDDGKDW